MVIVDRAEADRRAYVQATVSAASSAGHRILLRRRRMEERDVEVHTGTAQWLGRMDQSVRGASPFDLLDLYYARMAVG